MAAPVAIVTGGSSGIGLALVQHLISREWKVVIADLTPPRKPVPEARFITTDIAIWKDQAEMFKQAYEWGGRLDFCALNAGITDRDDIFNSLSRDPARPPREPNMSTFGVNLTGTYFGIKLASHYMTIESKAAGKRKPGGKIVITSSGTGIFPMPAIPMYSASKHGLVGLARNLGRSRAALDANIRINAVCPAIVATPALPKKLLDSLPPQQVTPMSTIMRCFDALVSFGDVGNIDWVETGQTGETLEGNIEDLIWHQPPQAAQKPHGEGTGLARDKLTLTVVEAYKEQNLKYVKEP